MPHQKKDRLPGLVQYSAKRARRQKIFYFVKSIPYYRIAQAFLLSSVFVMTLLSFTKGKSADTPIKIVTDTCLSPQILLPENEAAPLEVEKQYAGVVKDYIKLWAPVAQQHAKKYGVPASISLAQGIIESRSGTSKLAVNNNNHFGVKCFSKTCRKGHCSNFTDDTHKDFFRKYRTAKDSWVDHTYKLCNGRYKKLHRYGKNYRQWAYGLKACGYATDRTYAEKLIGVIERYNLHQYD